MDINLLLSMTFGLFFAAIILIAALLGYLVGRYAGGIHINTVTNHHIPKVINAEEAPCDK